MSKYDALWEYVGSAAMPLRMSFDEAERVLGFPIDHSFLSCKKELAGYGRTVKKISLKERYIIFEEANGRAQENNR